MIVLFNASLICSQRNYMLLRPHSELDTYHRIDKMIGLQIEDHCHRRSSWEHQIGGWHGIWCS